MLKKYLFFYLLAILAFSVSAKAFVQACQLVNYRARTIHDEHSGYAEALIFMNEQLKIRYPLKSMGDIYQDINPHILYDDALFEKIKRSKEIKTGCFGAALLLISLVNDDLDRLGLEEIFAQNDKLQIDQNSGFLASLLNIYYLSPQEKILLALQENGIGANQGHYLVLTSRKNRTFAGLGDGMENLDLATWKKKAAGNWLDLKANWSTSKPMQSEPMILSREKIEDVLKEFGGMDYLTNADSWTLHEMPMSIDRAREYQINWRWQEANLTTSLRDNFPNYDIDYYSAPQDCILELKDNSILGLGSCVICNNPIIGALSRPIRAIMELVRDLTFAPCSSNLSETYGTPRPQDKVRQE